MTDYRAVFDDCAERLNQELENCAELVEVLRKKVHERGGPKAGAELALMWLSDHPGVAQRIAMAVVVATIARESIEEAP